MKDIGRLLASLWEWERDLLEIILWLLRDGLTFTSQWLERGLVALATPWQVLVDTVARSSADEGASSTERAWWDPSRGTAIVIHGSGADQSVARSIALRLASEPAKTSRWRSFFAPSHLSGSPPYTCIVLLNSSEELLPLVSSWAERKATLDKLRMPSPDSHAVEAMSTKAEPAMDAAEYDRATSPSSSPRRSRVVGVSSSRRKRSLSIGSWHTPDVWSAGRDLFKGIRIGETNRKPIGSIIPVVIDTSSTEGLAGARTTILGYCSSHNLLLRALIVVPSLYDSKELSYPAEPHSTYRGLTSRPTHSSHHIQGGSESTSEQRGRSGTERSPVDSELQEARETVARQEAQNRRVAELEESLARDVFNTIGLISTLLPALQRDRGRLIGLLPSGWGGATLPSDDITSSQSRANEAVGTKEVRKGRQSSALKVLKRSSASFPIVRDALKSFWADVVHQSRSAGIQVCRVEAAANPPLTPWQAYSPPGFETVRKSGPGKQASATDDRQHTASAILRGRGTMMSDIAAAALRGIYFAIHPPLDIIVNDSKTPEKPAQSTEAVYPRSLLYTTILRAITRTHVRSWEPVGLGPRIESALEEVPGARWMQRQLGQWLRRDEAGIVLLERSL